MIIEPLHAPLNILLADDDRDDRFFFEKVLKEIPIATSLTTVLDGELLMDFLFTNSDNLPDVLFLDLSMPRKNGFECLTEIKENDKLKKIHIVMFSTSYSQDKIYERQMINTLFKIGAQDYISKPGTIDQLKKAIYDSLTKVILIGSEK